MLSVFFYLVIFLFVVLAFSSQITPESKLEIILVSFLIPLACFVLIVLTGYTAKKTMDQDGLIFAKQAFSLALLPAIISAFSIYFLLSKKLKKSIENGNLLYEEAYFLKKSTSYGLAIFVCAVMFILYIVSGLFFGWKHGGGVLPMTILFGALTASWKGIIDLSKDKHYIDSVEKTKKNKRGI